VRSWANTVLSLYALREDVEKYTDALAVRICPNMSHLAGPALAAKLVAKAGSLHKLATFPASTVQVIGAEKALFKHLKAGSKPPKHGVIFQHPLISTSPKKVRGKIARALAGKLSIAAKADAITHHFIAEKLKESFEARAKAILSSNKV
jgi:nucleolar protein 56